MGEEKKGEANKEWQGFGGSGEEGLALRSGNNEAW